VIHPPPVTRLSLALAGMLSLSSGLRAQSPDTLLKPRAQLQLWSAALGYSPISGELESRQGDSLVVRRWQRQAAGLTGPQSNIIRLSHLDSLMVRQPTGVTARSAGRRGAELGLVIGGTLGAVAAVASLHSPGSEYCQQPVEERLPCRNLVSAALAGSLGFLGLGTVGVAAGGTIGVVVGAGRSHRWVVVPLPRR
jgi:hypothetical protein